MADFALLGRAVAVALGGEYRNFDKCYETNQRRALEKWLDNWPIYPAIIDLLDSHPQGFYGSYADLLQRLERYIDFKPSDWPKSAKAFAKSLQRQGPALRKVGIMVKRDDKRSTEGFRVAIDRLQT